MVECRFHLKIPLFVMRQLVRHRTVSLNEISGRYSVFDNDFYIPQPERLKVQSTTNNQGSSAETVQDIIIDSILSSMKTSQEKAYFDYETYLSHNLAKEIARINLPLSLYTELYWKMDLNNLFHFIKLREDSHAQEEIQCLAEIMFQFLKNVVPLACEAFEDYIKNAITFSSLECYLLKDIINSLNFMDEEFLDYIISQFKDPRMGQREVKEFKEKIVTILK